MHYCWQLNASVAWNLGARTREQGWCKVESTLPPPMWPRFESWRWHHMWVEFVVGFLPCSKRFVSWYSRFPLSLKNNTSKFQFNLERTDLVSMSSMQLLSVCAPRVNRKKKIRAYKLLRQFLCWIMLAQLLHSCQNKKLMDITMSKLKWTVKSGIRCVTPTVTFCTYIQIQPIVFLLKLVTILNIKLCSNVILYLKTLLESSLAMCKCWAPVLSCVSWTDTKNSSGTDKTYGGIAKMTNEQSITKKAWKHQLPVDHSHWINLYSA